MSVVVARRFIQRALADEAFVAALNDVSTREEVQALLAREGLVFSYGHFDEAFYTLLTQCQHVGQAEMLQEIKRWWDFLEGHFAQQHGSREDLLS
jgi:hypothetical protein